MEELRFETLLAGGLVGLWVILLIYMAVDAIFFKSDK